MLQKQMKFNNSYAQYALRNDLCVEYFIWVYLKELNDSGCYTINDCGELGINKSTLKSKLKTNPFYVVSGGRIFTKSTHKLPVKKGRYYFTCDLSELNKFARKNSTTSNKIIKGWNSTLIKYLMICVFACRFEDKKPYALQLISCDTGCSVSTIQRALKNLFVERSLKVQEKDSPRSYMKERDWVNLSPNYNKLLIGKMFRVR